MQFGDFRLEIVRECTFKLDGGAMFGVVPKLLWARACPADDDNRILLSCNLLLIETPDGRVLIETGMGDRWSDRDRQRYEVTSLVDHKQVLQSLSLQNNEIDYVVLSHLHFDHAGGAVIRDDSGKLVPAFPRAKYIVQQGEWEFAHKANARAQASYRKDDFLPLADHGVLCLVDGDTAVLPGVHVRISGGHTRHHQVVTFESKGLKGIYFADIMPTRNHVNPPWVMGYDHYPLECCDAKSQYLKPAADERWLVVFDHEVDVPWGHVEINADDKFTFVPLPASTLNPGSTMVPV